MKSQATIEPAPPLLRVDVRPEHTLDDYAAVAHLAAAAGELKTEAARLVPDSPGGRGRRGASLRGSAPMLNLADGAPRALRCRQASSPS